MRIEAAGARGEFDAKQETLILGAEISESGERVLNPAMEATRVMSYAGGLGDGEAPTADGMSPGTQRDVDGGSLEAGVGADFAARGTFGTFGPSKPGATDVEAWVSWS
ncbi:hypothetical protein [Kribbella sp. VKM Ac-2566]|uniref:hypothetical protein n=1 Tax=Kribbella sp. VKM Ac-2566 TaxID=2512218 RepID=UPI001062C812|nr:hypothetical protein [Kribbella sp. VKM Ac-2566]TDW91096.1 hypothetical protein EV647_4664 [Kribbella sp. VKM Ac-2566]